MTVYLAGTEGQDEIFTHSVKPWREIAMLQSYYYLRTKKTVHIPDRFLLDSGAFTFIVGDKSKQVNWDEYVDQYAAFVKKHNVRRYFELDIDVIVGYDRVKQLRARLESQVGWPSIPVWHKGRGKDGYLEMCNGQYDYVALGGIAPGEITQERFKYLPWFVKTAHSKGIKVHGLGITSADWLRKCHFDSVDSATWLVGDRFSNICRFECVKGKWTMTQKHLYGKRCKDVAKLRQFNFNQWVLFQEYAETHL